MELKRFPGIIILIVAAVASASAMVLEVAGAHALAPGFGTGMNAWAAMIVVGLGGLACGYALGGFAADRWKEHLAKRVVPLLLVTGGLCFAADALVWHGLVTGLAAVGPRVGALLAGAVLFFVPFAALGAIYPAALKLWTGAIEELGRRSGLLSAVSAVGSLAGAAAAGFLLVPALSLESVFGACAVALILMAGVVLLSSSFKAGGILLILLGCLPVFLPARPLGHGVIHRRASLFGPVEVVDRGGARFLVVSGTIQGAMLKDSHESVFPYVQVLAEMLRRNLPAQQRKVLLVGLGAGLLPRLLEPGSCLTVEVDPATVQVAEEYFLFDVSRYPVRVADGRVFLLSSQECYGAVIFDAYGGGNHPYHMLTRECFELVKARLHPGGMFVLNYLGYVGGPNGRFVRSLEATLRAVFEHVEVYSSEEVADYANVIFVAHGPGVEIDWPPGVYERRLTFLDNRPVQLLADSRNPVALWSAAVEQRWREESQRMLSTE